MLFYFILRLVDHSFAGFYFFFVGISTGPAGHRSTGEVIFGGAGELPKFNKEQGWRFSTLENQVFDLKGDLERSCHTHTAIDKALDDARERYGRFFAEKEFLMLVGIEMEKKIRWLESERESTLSSFKALEEYAETRALDIIEGFWYGDK